MSLRELCNVAYTDLLELFGGDKDAKKRADLDTLLDEGEGALKARQQRDAMAKLRQAVAMPTRRP